MLRRELLLLKQMFFMKKIIKDCLVRKIDPAKIEEAFELEYEEFYMKKRKNSNGSVRNSYFREYEWNPFIAKMLKDDELWFYRLPAEFWQTLQGHQGYVLIRNGKIVVQVITKQN
ncbi:MAG: hypothetical protein VSS75_019715 [Candidatus Parabeggiatoa sp.]|nr:hypothetical protein [Candidatus Parabeggiatoa sp.]